MDRYSEGYIHGWKEAHERIRDGLNALVDSWEHSNPDRQEVARDLRNWANTMN